MDNMNKTLAIHSLLTLSLCYLPGVLAAWLQLGRGTKYSRFPRWLDSWMRMRKQLVNIWQCPASLQPATRDSSCCSPPPSTPSSPWPTCPRGTRISSSVRFSLSLPEVFPPPSRPQPTEVYAQVMEGERWGPKLPSVNKTSIKVRPEGRTAGGQDI